MKILNAEFVTSAAPRLAPPGLARGKPPADMGGIPRDGLAQFAFAGRSNVGKSTLLNALVRQKVARTSAAPGKTRLANIIRITAEGGPGGPGRWSCYFVDLPGYGYARGGDDAAKELAAVAEAYFGAAGERPRPERAAGGQPGAAGPASESAWGWGPTRSEKSRPAADGIRATFLLVDSRHPGLKSDVQAHRWLSELAGPPMVVATKVDKLSRAERTRNLRELERVFGTAAQPVSATSGEGMDELWRTIANLARGIGAADAATADDSSSR
ncbi:MAG TPA: GTP-binding protein 8 [Vicinamibacterales bacterium]